MSLGCPHVPARAQADVPVSYPRCVDSFVNWQRGAERISPCPARSGAEECKHREHPAMPVAGLGQAELEENLLM